MYLSQVPNPCPYGRRAACLPTELTGESYFTRNCRSQEMQKWWRRIACAAALPSSCKKVPITALRFISGHGYPTLHCSRHPARLVKIFWCKTFRPSCSAHPVFWAAKNEKKRKVRTIHEQILSNPKGIVRFWSRNKAVAYVFSHQAEPSSATRTGQCVLDCNGELKSCRIRI